MRRWSQLETLEERRLLAANFFAGELNFIARELTTTENAGVFEVTVERLFSSLGEVSVNYATFTLPEVGNSLRRATAGQDYQAVSGTLTFGPGETRKSFNLPILQDAVFEGTEWLGLRLSNPQGGATLGPFAEAALSILDDEPVPQFGALGFTVAEQIVSEGAGQALVRVVRTGGADGTVSVRVSASEGTARAGFHFEPVSQILTFNPGQTERTVTVPIRDNDLHEPNRTVALTLENPQGGATINPIRATSFLVIQDNDPAPPAGVLTLAATNLTVGEGDGGVTITLDRLGGSAGSVTVGYRTVAGTAEFSRDYRHVEGVLGFADGTTRQTLVVPILQDSLFEGDEVLFVEFFDVKGGAVLATPRATVTIRDDDPPPGGAIQFGSTTFQVAENGGGAVIELVRVRGAAGAASVTLNITDGTARNGVDYQASASTRVTFAPGQTRATVTIPVLDNDRFEGNRQLNLAISEPQGGAVLGELTRATLTIVEDEPPPPGRFSFAAQRFAANEGDGFVTIVVERRDGGNGVVSVDYQTVGVTATPGQDFEPVSGTLVFNEFVTRLTFRVPIRQDTVFEGDETFDVVLSNPGGGARLGATPRASVTIIDDDPAPRVGRLQFAQSSQLVDEGAGRIAVVVERIEGADLEVSVAFATQGVTATPNLDFTPVSGRLVFGPGVTRQTIEIPIIDDAIHEGTVPETFRVVLSDPRGGLDFPEIRPTLGGRSTTEVGILDNDPARRGQFVLANPVLEVNETAGFAEVVVERIDGADGPVSVVFATLDGTATAGLDYISVNEVLTFSDGVTRRTVRIPILDDAVFEGNETVAFALSSPTGGAILGNPSSGVLTILDDDPEPRPGSFAFAAATLRVNENAGNVAITVNRLNGFDGVASVSYTVVAGTARPNDDFLFVGGSLTFAPGETSQTFLVAIIDDNLFEGDETFTLVLTSPTNGATLAEPSSLLVTIADNDPPPQRGAFRLTSATLSINEGAGPLLVTIERVGGTDGEATVQLLASSTSAATGSARPGEDYGPVPNNGLVLFPNGVDRQVVAIPIFDDSLIEGNETFTLTLVNPTGGATLSSPASAVVTIIDNDQPALRGQIQFASPLFRVSEGAGRAEVVLERIGGSAGEVAVSLQSRNGTALAGFDFVAVSQVVRFGDGVTRQVVPVTILNDNLVEGDETFELILSTPTGGATLGNQVVATVLIEDNDLPQRGAIQFTTDTVTVSEDAGVLVINLARVNGSDGAVSVRLRTVSGTAVAGEDFTAIDGVVTFAAGQTTQTVLLGIRPDLVVEPTETLQVILSNPTNGATLGEPSVLTVSILNVTPAFQGLNLPASSSTPPPADLEPTPAPSPGHQPVVVVPPPAVSEPAPMPEPVVVTPNPAPAPVPSVSPSPLRVSDIRVLGGRVGLTAFEVALVGPTAPTLAAHLNALTSVTTAGTDGRFGTPDDRIVPTRTEFDPAANTLRLVPFAPLPLNQFVRVEVRDGLGGVARAARLALGDRLTVQDRDGDRALVSLLNGGLFEVVSSDLDDPERLRIVNAPAGRRGVLVGTLRSAPGSDGRMVFGRMDGLGLVTHRLNLTTNSTSASPVMSRPSNVNVNVHVKSAGTLAAARRRVPMATLATARPLAIKPAPLRPAAIDALFDR